MNIAGLLELINSRKAANLHNPARRWYDIRNLAADEAEVFLYDVIGESWFGGITAAQFVKDLREVQANRIILRINSPGGDIADATAIRNALIQHPANIETHIDGMAASCASWVGLAGEKVVMSQNAVMMIHEPFSFVAGGPDILRKEADVLDMFGDNIADMYVKKAGGKRNDWRDRMRAETWYTDQQAVDAGLADEIGGEAKAENRFDPSLLRLFEHTPNHLIAPAPSAPTPAPQPERIDLTTQKLAFERTRAALLGVA